VVSRQNEKKHQEKNAVKENDIHNSSLQLERALQLLDKPHKKLEKVVSTKNKEIIKRFASACIAEGLTKIRVAKYIGLLKYTALMLNKDFDKVTKDDLIKFVTDLELNSEYSEWTKNDYKVALKKFYKWFKGNGEEYPEEVKWIKTGKKIRNNKLPDELLTPDEIKEMADAATNLRDRAIVLTLYESGARAEELLNMKIKNIVFDNYGALVMLNGKTGMRRVRLIASVPAISAWLSIHPYKDNKNAWLWVGLSTTNWNSRLSYASLRKLLKELAKKAEIDKPVNPHNFRHSRATELAKHLTEAQLCQVMGWVQGSKQTGTYVHLSQRDTDEAILKIYGLLEKKEKQQNRLMTITCPRCGRDNPPNNRICMFCGMALDVKYVTATREENLVGVNLVELLKNNSEQAKEIAQFLASLIKEMQ